MSYMLVNEIGVNFLYIKVLQNNHLNNMFPRHSLRWVKYFTNDKDYPIHHGRLFLKKTSKEKWLMG